MEDITVTLPHDGIDEAASTMERFVPQAALALAASEGQRGIPLIAKTPNLVELVEEAVRHVPSTHRLVLAGSQSMDWIGDESIHLIVTSPPYWTLKPYPEQTGQLGRVQSYDAFLGELDKVWRHCLRVLVPGGRLVIVVGDVCLPRRTYGRHVVFPLHASIQERCRTMGFDNLAPIIWYKITNARFEVENGSSFLGKPYEPNAIVKNDVEYVLFQRKPGGYRQPTMAARILSLIPEKHHREWFQQVWTLGGASTRHHPAPYPLNLAERIVRMFSFAGDVVLDPFMGTGTTNVAAARWGRHSIGVEVEPSYFQLAHRRLMRAAQEQGRLL